MGRRLATKLLNASRFVLGFPSGGSAVTGPLDLAMLAALDSVVASASAALEGLEYTTALEATERFFWSLLRRLPGAGQAACLLRRRVGQPRYISPRGRRHPGDPDLLAAASTVMAAIRKAKSEARQSMRVPVASVVVRGPLAESLRAVSAGIQAAGNVGSLVLEPSDGTGLDVQVRLDAQ